MNTNNSHGNGEVGRRDNETEQQQLPRAEEQIGENARIEGIDRDDHTRDAINLPTFGYRHIFSMLGFFGFLVVYFLRVCVSVAVVSMAQEFKWSDQQRGAVLSSFFVGYILLQIPGGSTAERIGGKWIFGGGVAAACIFTILTPVAARASFSYLVGVRALTGLCEGVTFPSMHAMLSRWAPPGERTSLGAFTYCGAGMGSVLAMPVTAVMCDRYGWESVFYMSGLVGIVWSIIWAIFGASCPSRSRFMGAEEKEAIARSLAGTVRDTRPPVPLKAILSSPPFYAILIAHVSKAYGDYTLLTEMPTYMEEVLHFSLKEDGFLSSLPFVLGFFTGIGSGVCADKLRGGRFTTTTVRKAFNSVGFFVPAFAFAAVAISGELRTLCVVMLCVAVGFGGFTNAGVSLNHIDIAPNFAGTLMAFTNMAANFCGIIAPAVAGAITNNHPDEDHWRTVFLIASLISLIGGAAFLILASGEEQDFNRIEPDNLIDNIEEPLIHDDDDDSDLARPVPQVNSTSVSA